MPRKTMPIQWNDNWQRLFDAGTGEERDTYRRQMVEGLQRDAYEEGDADGFKRGLDAAAEQWALIPTPTELSMETAAEMRDAIRTLLPEEDNEDG